MTTTTTTDMDLTRAAVIARIKTALQRRSGKAWSVTGGKGTAYGWITIDAPPARRTARFVQRPGTAGNPGDFDDRDTGELGGHITPDDRAALAALLGLETVHFQGVNVAAGHDYYREYIDRAEGRAPSVTGRPYWD